ncbi:MULTISPECIES: YihY/virulence factor BrkB family protein [Pseudomonas]|jgi:membrane protein|uniref:YihY/virulence factor BrkB family protein n=1 Tax=Pseudomonas TaxID=286 RepID=UPI001C7E1F5C|nr:MULTISPECIES: YihY/virulence factor BrkB family protein [Pseudomonas]MDG9930460.1 YihY/virulence factor BrkB family protein [Pseudomonas sp. GD04042]MDH0482990.1 YihY/virulence factor BrkB family protein [Pseudomonas sp. GD04015]MDH0605390.1 YihY/virulence factor BrkB family protein [Pseudomonas sp. GD03869]
MAFIDLRGVSWWTLVRGTVTDFIDDELPVYASALAFQLFFSLFPFLLFLIALIGVLDAQPIFDWLHQQAELVLPQDALGLVDPVITQLQTQQPGLFSIGILLALWTASAAVRSTMAAMNRAYGVEDGRPAWKLVPLSLLYTVGIAIALLTAAALMVVGPQAMNWLATQIGLEETVVVLWAWLRWPLAVLMLILVVAAVYYLAPDVKQEFRFITPGSILAVVVWIAASLGFGYYAQNFANYNATYGSIGAIIVFLLYLYISSAVLLFGAEMNAVIEHHANEGKDPGEKEAG